MTKVTPATPRELAAVLAEAATAKRSIQVEGAGSKRRMGGHCEPAEVAISTAGLGRVLEYEPKDLTISVEAGVRWADLQARLAANHQMIPLDPPFHDEATVGGVLSANTCGPRRRAFGSARDMVIGMKFATLDGEIVQSGGMVVKNVAGLDMAKLMIGSFGTLGVIAVANFKLTPVPPRTRTFLLAFETLEQAMAKRDEILEGVLQPWSIDLLNPHACGRFDRRHFLLALQAGGSDRVMDRYTRELSGAEILEGAEADAFWTEVREFVPEFLRDHEEGSVVRVSSTLREMGGVIARLAVPVVARAGSGITYAMFPDCDAAAKWTGSCEWPAVVETVPPRTCSGSEQWPRPGSDFAVMKRIKDLLDPGHLLNRGRLYGRI